MVTAKVIRDTLKMTMIMIASATASTAKHMRLE